MPPRLLELRICEAIRDRRVLECDYGGSHRILQPYCHGVTRAGAESLRAVQVNHDAGARRFGKLWTVARIENLRVTAESFIADDPDYNPDDSAFVEIHCRVTPSRPARRPDPPPVE